jgi:hypothetical protein
MAGRDKTAGESRLKKVLALLNGAFVILAEPANEEGEEWIGLSFMLKTGEEVSFVVARDDESNGPGALLGLWDFARKHGI